MNITLTLDLPDRYADKLISRWVGELLDEDPGPPASPRPKMPPKGGTRSKRRKLMYNDVQGIRRAFLDGTPARFLAEHYGISLSHTYAIISGRTWGAQPPAGLDGSDLGTLRVTR